MAGYRDTHVLRHMQSVSEAFARKLAAYAPSPANQPDAHDLFPSDLQLPCPKPVAEQLIASGVDENSARRISHAFLEAGLRLKDSCEAGFARRRELLRSRAHYYQSTKAAHSIPLTYKSLYTRTLREWTAHLLTNIVPRILRARAYALRSAASNKVPGRQTRRPFNQSALPLLERFFEQNAFPSRLEKYELASKSDMDYRQIHVWFQNRRSRSKKEGRELHRGSQNAALQQLENSIADTLLPPERVDDKLDSYEENTKANRPSSSGFQLDAPAHAFPSPYPPICSYEPFPVTAERRKLETRWERASHHCQGVSTADVDVDGLSAAFGRLSIEDASQSHRGASASNAPKACSPIRPPCIGFTTPCARAPHPALVWSPMPTHSRRRHIQVGATHDSHAPKAACPSPRRTLPRRVPRHPFMRSSVCPPWPTPRLHDANQPHRTVSSLSTSSSYHTSDSEGDSPISTPPLLPIDVLSIPTIAIPGWDELVPALAFADIPPPIFPIQDYPTKYPESDHVAVQECFASSQ